ncbi:MAG: flavodoxin family protein [Candidatus Thorarchaeota archaeon]|nr:flavodoxin family protein [Candidatus Thorarchaeota archaeon]MCK5240716.1 flavodoxin family protein [Candidatus Thorarchaeota archaeon]
MSTTENQILGIVGSPRRGSNTEILVDEVLSGAEDAGAKTKKIILSTLDVRPCRGCDACLKTRQCVQKDDFLSLVKEMQNSDVWVLGTPVYWWGPTAQFKAFLDRWYSVDSSIFKGKKAIVVIPLGGGKEHYARHLTGMFEDIFDYLGIYPSETIVVPSVNKRKEVLDHPDILKFAHDTGKRVIEAVP